MERSKTYFLSLFSIICLIFSIYVWSDKNKTSESLRLALEELRKTKLPNLEIIESEQEILRSDALSLFETFGSGDMFRLLNFNLKYI